MKTSELIFFPVFLVVIALIVWMAVRDHLRKKRTIAALSKRTRRNDEEFGREWFGDPERANIAVRVRRILSKNLDMPLAGLVPGDRLEEDLRAELPRNPQLFWDLEEEFEFKSELDDAKAFDKAAERLVTFKDLVEYVESKISDPNREIRTESEEEKSSRTYSIAIRSVMPLCIGGLLVAIAGTFVQKRTMMNIGVIIFLSGIAVWGFANGGELLKSVVQTVRDTPRKEIRALPLLFLACVALVFLWMGYVFLSGILSGILKGAWAPK